KLIISDACMGLYESAGEYFPKADWQRCMVHFHRNVASRVPRNKTQEVAKMLKAIYAQESKGAALEKASAVTQRLREMKLPKAADLIEEKIGETNSY
ncbi:MAG: transposase, partial [Pseudomonadota bacterium]